ncbi:hypothetical protein [Gracilibacillus kekensis]|uniref:Uncharacterized protein n=1 Tax=Gracilibacillus kekensis TaxID=1027249 RepID=A0A1M7JMM7_9BACI|nr:hypothetical protein [Gracilibacillus kekensis]SHM54151.1 hypothetical protein SAMN05216179_0415 [Gracilibacillus kekensis]
MSNWYDDFLSKEQQHQLSNFSKKAKKELASLPILSVVTDATQGATGVADLQEKLEKEPDNPLYWLFFYEALITYQKWNSGMNVGRAVINPFGFVVGKGVASGLNAIDEDFEKASPSTYLGIAIALTAERVKSDEHRNDVEDLVILGKALAYSSAYANSNRKRYNLLKKAIQYLTKAIQIERIPRFQAEFFFYLAQFYQLAGNQKMYFRSLNISRKIGFTPAESLLKDELKQKVADGDREKLLSIGNSTQIKNKFIYTFQFDFDQKFEGTIENVKKKQAEKIRKTSSRIQKLFD